MRSALDSPEYPPAPALGGVGTNTAVLARALRDLGHRVVVITRGDGGRGEQDGVEVVRVRAPGLPPLPGRRTVQLVLGRVLIALAVRRERPDVVHAAEWQAEAWLVARAGRRLVVTRLATPTHVVEELNRGGSRRDRLVEWMERDQTRRSVRVYGPTEAIIDRVSRDWDLDRDRIVRIPNSIDLAEAVSCASSEPAVRGRTVVFIGRLERRKGIEVLGAALPAVLRSFPDVHAVLVGRDAGEGGGGVMAAFQSGLRETAGRVHVLGELPRDEALAVVSNADVVALPSLWESFGYVCVEAMALGRPVVASRAGGLEEIISDGVDGLLVPPGDACALATAISRVLAGPELARGLGTGARRRSAAFDVAAVAPRVAGLLEEADARTLDDRRRDRA